LTDFSLDFEGMATLQEQIGDLKDDYGEANTRVVYSGASYSIHIEMGRGPVEPDSADALRFEDEDGNIIYRASAEGHPPYPFFWPAVREFEANPESFILRNSDVQSLNAAESANDLVEIVADSLQSQMRKNANANRPAHRSPGTHPEHPVAQSGNLIARIQVQEV
jgi:hypothetical protein